MHPRAERIARSILGDLRRAENSFIDESGAVDVEEENALRTEVIRDTFHEIYEFDIDHRLAREILPLAAIDIQQHEFPPAQVQRLAEFLAKEPTIAGLMGAGNEVPEDQRSRRTRSTATSDSSTF